MSPRLIPRRRSRAEAPGKQPAIATDWHRVADGRPWRMERGVDFSKGGPAFRRAAERAAGLMDKRVIMVRDRLDPGRFVWIQFVDGEIALGDPCACGGRRFFRLTGQLLRCRSCGATMIATPRTDDDDEDVPAVVVADESEPRQTLAQFRHVKLRRVEVAHDAERYVGTGLDADGVRVLLAVRVPLVAGAPVPDASSPTGSACEVLLAVPDEAPGEGVDAGRWDMVLE